MFNKFISYFTAKGQNERYIAKRNANHKSEICYRFEPLETITAYEVAWCVKAYTIHGSRYCFDQIGALISEKAFNTLDPKLQRHWVKDKTKNYIYCR